MKLKTIPHSNTHPGGGIKVIRTFWNSGKVIKREKSLYAVDYSSREEMKEAAEQLYVDLLKEIKADLRGTADPLFTASLNRTIVPHITLKRIAKDRIRKLGDASMGDYFKRIIDLCGDQEPDNWRDAYYLTIEKLQSTVSERTGRPLTDSTVNRYKATFRMIFMHGIKEKVITEMPADIEIGEEDGRDRVWTPGERDRIFEALEGSWLYFPVYFSSINPIRASDLFGNPDHGNPGLRKDNWKSAKNWVEFLANKTGRGKNAKKRPTYLKQIDNTLRDYFNALPANCDYLFPRILPDGTYRPLNMGKGYREYEAEWDRVMEKAGVEDLRWHDLKHCAITFLLDHSYTEKDLKNCGIQFSRKMIEHYYHHDAEKAPVIEGFEKPGLKVLERSA